ncbi:hypothetical protein D3C72_1244780 [compost metagenome]
MALVAFGFASASPSAFLAAVFLAFAGLPPVPVLAIRSAINTSASFSVTEAGSCPFGMVALTLPQFT